MDAQANLTVGSGEKRLSFRSSENASRTIGKKQRPAWPGAISAAKTASLQGRTPGAC